MQLLSLADTGTKARISNAVEQRRRIWSHCETSRLAKNVVINQLERISCTRSCAFALQPPLYC